MRADLGPNLASREGDDEREPERLTCGGICGGEINGQVVSGLTDDGCGRGQKRR